MWSAAGEQGLGTCHSLKLMLSLELLGHKQSTLTNLHATLLEPAFQIDLQEQMAEILMASLEKNWD